MTPHQSKIIANILKERERQDKKWGADRSYQSIGAYSIKFHLGEEYPVPDSILELLGRRVMSEVLMEEVGEVARASLEGDLAEMRTELIQVAAVAMAMVEYLDKLNRGQNNEPSFSDSFRDYLGEKVREVWIEWANQQENTKPSWLVPYDGLSEPDKEADRMIGERLYQIGQLANQNY